jgi:hypothetical protein
VPTSHLVNNSDQQGRPLAALALTSDAAVGHFSASDRFRESDEMFSVSLPRRGAGFCARPRLPWVTTLLSCSRGFLRSRSSLSVVNLMRKCWCVPVTPIRRRQTGTASIPRCQAIESIGAMMGSVAEYEQFDAIDLALIARREVMALGVLDEAITRAEKLNPAIKPKTSHHSANARGPDVKPFFMPTLCWPGSPPTSGAA